MSPQVIQLIAALLALVIFVSIIGAILRMDKTTRTIKEQLAEVIGELRATRSQLARPPAQAAPPVANVNEPPGIWQIVGVGLDGKRASKRVRAPSVSAARQHAEAAGWSDVQVTYSGE